MELHLNKIIITAILLKSRISANYIAELQKMNPYIVLNKYKLRSIIGRWPASSYNSHTITSAINEIILHVENDDLGTYNYYTAKKDGTYTALYTLTITADCTIFNDVFNNKFYRLMKKWKGKFKYPTSMIDVHFSTIFFDSWFYTV